MKINATEWFKKAKSKTYPIAWFETGLKKKKKTMPVYLVDDLHYMTFVILYQLLNVLCMN